MPPDDGVALAARNQAGLDVAVVGQIDLPRRDAFRSSRRRAPGTGRAPFEDLDRGGARIEEGGAVRGSLDCRPGQEEFESSNTLSVPPAPQPVEPDQSEGQGGIPGPDAFRLAQSEERPAGLIPLSDAPRVPSGKRMLAVGAMADALDPATREVAPQHPDQLAAKLVPLSRAGCRAIRLQPTLAENFQPHRDAAVLPARGQAHARRIAGKDAFDPAHQRPLGMPDLQNQPAVVDQEPPLVEGQVAQPGPVFEQDRVFERSNEAFDVALKLVEQRELIDRLWSRSLTPPSTRPIHRSGTPSGPLTPLHHAIAHYLITSLDYFDRTAIILSPAPVRADAAERAPRKDLPVSAFSGLR